MKKLISLLLSVFLILSVSAGAFAEEYTVQDNDVVNVTGAESGQTVEITNGAETRVASHVDENPVFSSQETVKAVFYLDPDDGDVTATFKDISLVSHSQSAITIGEDYSNAYQQLPAEKNSQADFHSVEINLNNADITSTNTEAIITAASVKELTINVENENEIVSHDLAAHSSYTSAVVLDAIQQENSKISIVGIGDSSSLTVQASTNADTKNVYAMSVWCDGDIEVKDVNLTVVAGDEDSAEKVLKGNLVFKNESGETNISNSTIIAANYSGVSGCPGDALTFESDSVNIDSSTIVAITNNSGNVPALISRSIPSLSNSCLENFEWKLENDYYCSVNPDGTYASKAIIREVSPAPVTPIPIPVINVITADGNYVDVKVEIIGNALVISSPVEEASLSFSADDLKALVPYGIESVTLKTKCIEVSFSVSDVLAIADDNDVIAMEFQKDSAKMTVGSTDVSNILSVIVL